jgi:hypothetical protein
MAKKIKKKNPWIEREGGGGPLMPRAGETIHDTRVMMHV